MTTGSIHIGCSGWQYRHWRDIFYPRGVPQRAWFDHYASVFATVEINTSFYHLPKPETFDKWRDQAPPGFRYAVKASRFITHMKKLKSATSRSTPFSLALAGWKVRSDRSSINCRRAGLSTASAS